ncbi:YecA family protein [Reinekea forsetii]|nr:YecA family protein [Reinekea forsetii]
MSEIDVDQLADWLESEQRSEDCFDIHGLHGYLTALAICSEPVSDEWLATAIDQPLTELEESEAIYFANTCVALHSQIAEELYSDDAITLTFEPTVDYQESDMEAWCQGFMEVVFELPEHFQHKDEEQMSVLMLPIEVASGFFAEEPDFKQFYQQKSLLKQMFDEIPDILTDLYLLLNVPTK